MCDPNLIIFQFIVKEQNWAKVVMSCDFEELDKSLMVEVIRLRQAGQSLALQAAQLDQPPPPLPPAAPHHGIVERCSHNSFI